MQLMSWHDVERFFWTRLLDFLWILQYRFQFHIFCIPVIDLLYCVARKCNYLPKARIWGSFQVMQRCLLSIFVCSCQALKPKLALSKSSACIPYPRALSRSFKTMKEGMVLSRPGFTCLLQSLCKFLWHFRSWASSAHLTLRWRTTLASKTPTVCACKRGLAERITSKIYCDFYRGRLETRTATELLTLTGLWI